MKNERNHQGFDADELAVWLIAGESPHGDAIASADDETLAAVTELRGIDGALRTLAAAESPDAYEMRRMRDAAIRTTRLHAIEAMRRRTLSATSQRRRLPKWPMAAAAAAAVVVGFVVWVTNQQPVVIASTSNSLVGDSEQRSREEWRAEYSEYLPLVAAFEDVEPVESLMPETLDDIDSQISALSMLGGTVAN